MRVCFYHAEPEWSGHARAFADAAAALRGRGYDVTFVCQRGSVVERRLAAAGHEPIGIRTRGNSLGVGWGRPPRVRGQPRRAAAPGRSADRGPIVRRMPPFGSLTLGGDARFAARIAATGFLFAFDADLRDRQSGGEGEGGG